MLSLFFVTVIVVVHIILGILAFSKKQKSKINKVFSTLVFFIVIWIVANYLENAPIGDKLNFLFLNIDFASGIIVFYFFLLFCFNFHEIFILKKKIIFYLVAALTLLFAIASFFQWVTVNPRITEKGLKFDLGPLFYIYVVYMFFCLIAGSASLIFKLKKTKGIKRTQTVFILLGLVISALIALVINLFLQRFVSVDVFRIGNYGLIFFVAFTTYAIIKHRFMDIRIIIKQGTVYIMSLLVVIGVTEAGVLTISPAINRNISYWLIIFGLIFGILIFDPVKRIFQRFANKYLFTSLCDYQKTVSSLSQELTTTIDLDKIISSIIKITRDTMRLDQVGVLLRNKDKDSYKIQKIIGFQKEEALSLTKTGFITKYLEKTKEILVFEELELAIERTSQKELKSNLESLKKQIEKPKVAICLPLFRKEKIQGLIILGNKVSHDAYSSQDLELLEALANQSSVAIENARLYNELQDLTAHLQEKVDEQTQDMKKLFEIKNEFLHLVSHQLRTPLTALRGLVALLNEKDFEGSPREEQKKTKKRIYDSCEKLTNLTNDMLDTLNLEQGRIKFRFVKFNLLDSIKELVEMLRPRFEKKGLYVKILKPKKALTAIQADKLYLPQALQNIIDNAARYTKEGGLTISFKRLDKNHIQILFKDTGMGVTVEDKKYLFHEKFFRGKRANRGYTSGTGLGLYLAGHIIAGHHGKIEIESEGRDCGSEFIVTLPIKQKQDKKA